MNRYGWLAALCIGVASVSSWAQGYPTKPIKVVVPFPPGGSADVIIRILQPVLGRQLGQSIVIENKPGGGGVTGTNDVIHSAADGYSLVVTTLSTIAANPAINPKTPYGLGDYTPVVNMAATATLIAVNPAFPAKDYQAFIAELKRHPAKYSYGSSGMGGISHLQMETFKSLTGVFMTHIPYRGAAPALVDAIGGQIAVVMDAVPSASPFLRSGQLRPMVVASPKRLPIAPDVPTFAEVGLPEMNQRSYFGLIGPKGLAPDVVAKINAAVNAALEDPQVRQRLDETGADPVGGTAAEFAAAIRQSYTQLKKVVDERKLTLGT